LGVFLLVEPRKCKTKNVPKKVLPLVSSIFELRKYKSSNPFFSTDYIFGNRDDFAVAHKKSESLEGEIFEVIATYASFEDFKMKEKELMDSFYSERIYKGESFSLYGCCENGVIAGF